MHRDDNRTGRCWIWINCEIVSHVCVDIIKSKCSDLQHSTQFPSCKVHQEMSEMSKDVWAGTHFTLKIQTDVVQQNNTTFNHDLRITYFKHG